MKLFLFNRFVLFYVCGFGGLGDSEKWAFSSYVNNIFIMIESNLFFQCDKKII